MKTVSRMPHFNPIGCEFELTIPRASVSLSAMKRITLPALVLAVLVTHVSDADAKITAAECEADYAEMLAETEGNRARSIDELTRQLRLTSDDDTAASLNNMIEQAWEIEDSFRTMAARIFRDCMESARVSGS